MKPYVGITGFKSIDEVHAVSSLAENYPHTIMFGFLTSYKDFRYTEEQANTYKTIGGTPRLDAAYTVFGEVVEGLDIVDKLAAVPTDPSDKPVSDIRILKIKIAKK